MDATSGNARGGNANALDPSASEYARSRVTPSCAKMHSLYYKKLIRLASRVNAKGSKNPRAKESEKYKETKGGLKGLRFRLAEKEYELIVRAPLVVV